MVVDVLFRGFNSLSHKSGNNVLGINAGFGDGHVAWQDFKVVTDGFNLDVLKAISDGGTSGGINLRYAQSCWRP
jgi:prepilin-type processing-associated H-X9-DG protein